MSRILWWLLIGLAAWWLIHRLRGDTSGGPVRPAGPARPPAPAAPAAMVRCAHCGLHLPQTEAVPDDAGRSYCSTAHRAAGPG